MIVYRLPKPFTAAIAACAAILGGCASLPAGHPTVASPQPLQHLVVTPVAATDDLLAMKLAGQFALEGGDVQAAAREFAKAAARSDDPGLVDEAVEIAFAAKDWDLARSGIAHWQQLRADDPALWQWRASLALHDGKPDAAFADLQRLARQPDAKGWNAVGRVLIGASDKTQAGELLGKLAVPEALGKKSATWVAASQLADHLGAATLADALAGQAVARFGDAAAYVWSAELKLKSGDKAGARAQFVQALKRNAQDTHLRAAYATVLAQMGDNVEAAKVLAIGKQDDYTYAARAAYLARADDKILLASLYGELNAYTSPPSNARLNLLGQLAELLGRKSAALDWYGQVAASDARWPQAQLRIALLEDETGHTDKALALLHALQARSSDDDKQIGDAYTMEAEILRKHDRGREAVAVYSRALQAMPDDPRLLYARALLNDDLGNVDAAVDDLRALIKLQPDNADALNALGYTLVDHGRDLPEAQRLIEKALAYKPDEPAIIDSLGWVQYRLGHLKQAVEHLRAAYARQPDPEIAAHLGEVLWVSGDKDEARKIWAQGQQKDAKDKVLQETIKRLES
ncbi:MAG: tetratricopeptide repeat protein [Proteobacteria bacterium]|nr:tetratricopeptide repeat protein [Pseudomonadota bacterium]